MRKLSSILLTGGAGFIGSNFIRYLLLKTDFKGIIINLDKLTYAGNLENLSDVERDFGGNRYFFKKADICDFDSIKTIIKEYSIDTMVHFAAESHVDRSILGPNDFIQTNIIGTFTLLEAARECWKNRKDVLFHHISTDEVFGSLGLTGYFKEDTPYNPKSPYSASKASSDHLVRAINNTYNLPVTISNCSNNYGPYQFPEKLIPLMILNALDQKPLPIYGDGKNIRDWIFVDDHNSAVWSIVKAGKAGETYNIGGDNEQENIQLISLLCERLAIITKKDRDYYKKYITFVKNRPGHDKRYAVNCDKIKKELNWKSKMSFSDGLDLTIKWYLKNKNWVDHIKSGKYKEWIKANYTDRE